MSDLISRKDALSLLTVFTEKDALGSTPAEIIKHMPCVDSVVHGHWVDKPTGRYGQWQSWCSVCGKHSGIGGIESNRHKPFCPNCGSKMDLDMCEIMHEVTE